MWRIVVDLDDGGIAEPILQPPRRECSLFVRLLRLAFLVALVAMFALALMFEVVSELFPAAQSRPGELGDAHLETPEETARHTRLLHK